MSKSLMKATNGMTFVVNWRGEIEFMYDVGLGLTTDEICECFAGEIGVVLRGKRAQSDSEMCIRDRNVIDALTHQDHQIDTGDVQRLVKGREYVFFLMDSPSPNQDYLFMVNPVQGAISISGNDLIVLSSNKAAYGKYSTEMILFHAIDNMLKY